MSLKHALLGFLDYGPMAGYQLSQVLEVSIQHFWHANLSQIYPTLNQMERDGLLTQEVQYQTDRPNRKVYHITEQGRAELMRWLREPLESPPDRIPFLIQVFFGSRLNKAELLGLVRHHLDLHRRQLADYQLHTQHALDQSADAYGLPEEKLYWDLTLRAGILNEQFWIQWCEEAIDRIEKLAQATPAATEPSQDQG